MVGEAPIFRPGRSVIGAPEIHLPDVGLCSIESKNDQPFSREPKLLIDCVWHDGEHFVQFPRLTINQEEFILMHKQDSSAVTEPVPARPVWYQSLVFVRVDGVSSYPKRTAVLWAQKWSNQTSSVCRPGPGPKCASRLAFAW